MSKTDEPESSPEREELPPPPPAGLIGALKLLKQHWGKIIAYNEFTAKIELLQEPPTPISYLNRKWKGDWTDAHTTMCWAWLTNRGVKLEKSVVNDAVEALSTTNKIHSVRSWLKTLTWDGEKRIDDWLIKYAGAKDNPISREGFAKWMISAVARAMQPGCQADHVLILEGVQGAGKSSFYNILGGEWYSTLEAKLGNKDAAIGLFGKWIIELPELTVIKKTTDFAEVKSFITTRVDSIRLPYARFACNYPRHCVLGASTNETEWLNDDEGRRWWPVWVEKDSLVGNLARLKADREQLWAEAVARYNAGESWHIEDSAALAEIEKEIDKRKLVDTWDKVVRQFLKNRTQTDTLEIIVKALGISPSEMTLGHQVRVGKIIKSLKWSKHRLDTGWVFRSPSWKPLNLEVTENVVIPGPWKDKK